MNCIYSAYQGLAVVATQFARRSRSAIALALLACLAACAGHPTEAPLPQMAAQKAPVVVTNPETGMRSTEVSVLIYNVAGLPWPIKTGRTKQLKKIGAELAAMRAAGTHPDIVLLQEAFSAPSGELVSMSGYPNFVRGPARRDVSPEKLSPEVEASFKKDRRFFKGEKFGKWMNSGLYALTDYAILAKRSRPFKRYECAGYDCLSNKGILGIAVQIPGVPSPLQVVTTHMNSRNSTGVSEERSLRAHNLQMDELDDFLDANLNEQLPMIYGGDFNMKNARDRLDYAATKRPYPTVRRYCTRVVDDCDIRMSFDGDEPWLRTQDLQGAVDGALVKIRPIRAEALFDEPVDGKMLSDHDGYLVTYRLSWMPE